MVMAIVSSTMACRHHTIRLSYVVLLLLISCTDFFAASQKCEYETNDLYVFRSLGFGNFVLDGSDPEKITLQNLNGSDAQLWRFRPASRLGLSYIINEHHGKALDFITDPSGMLRVVLRDLQKSLDQRWNFDVHGHIVNAAKNKHVDIINENYVAGNYVQLWADNGCRCQQFFLQKKLDSDFET